MEEEGGELGPLALHLLQGGLELAGHGVEGVGEHADLVVGLHLNLVAKVPLGHPGQELWDLLVDGAAGHAGLFPAVQAAHGLPHGLQGGVAQGHLVKVLAPEVLGLLRHRGPFVYQVDHFAAPSFGSRLAWRWSRLS